MSDSTDLIKLSNGTEIEAQVQDGVPYVNLKRMCEALGVGYSNQRKKLQALTDDWAVIVFITTTGSDDKKYDMVYISAATMHGWLIGIKASKVKEEFREALRVYQREALKAVESHYNNNPVTRHDPHWNLHNQIAAGIREGIAPVNEKIEEVDRKVDEVDRKVDALGFQVSEVVRRKDLLKEDKVRHLEIIRVEFSGRCPCCYESIIVDGESLSGQFDHWYCKSRRSIHETWYVCIECNLKLRDPSFKESRRSEFDVYQKRREMNGMPLYKKQLT